MKNIEILFPYVHQVDSKKQDMEATIPQETMQTLKDLGLFGMQVPQEYGTFS